MAPRTRSRNSQLLIERMTRRGPGKSFTTEAQRDTEGGRNRRKRGRIKTQDLCIFLRPTWVSHCIYLCALCVLCGEVVRRAFRRRVWTLSGCRSWHSQTTITRQPRRRRRRTCRRSLATFRANFSDQNFRWVLGVVAMGVVGGGWFVVERPSTMDQQRSTH